MPSRSCLHAALSAAIIVVAASSPGLAASQKFGGYECPTDCKGHQAGFRWAHENHVPNKSNCIVGETDFIEGCMAYVDNPLRGSDLDDSGAAINW